MDQGMTNYMKFEHNFSDSVIKDYVEFQAFLAKDPIDS
jgi:hypothetical protein